MRMPALEGVIERRLLINYRVEPQIAARLLPMPFRPQLVNGQAVAGICLLRLEQLRPVGFPRLVGQRSENVAHRIAVEWDGDDGVEHGVFITRRDSNSMLNVAVGGRLFPGVHHKASFEVAESDHEITIDARSRDGESSVSVRARNVDDLEGSQLFQNLADASAFFERGSIGFSPRGTDGTLDAMELTTDAWAVGPLLVEHVHSSFFESPTRFPQGSAVLDCGLAMRRVPVEWHEARPVMVDLVQASGH
jgi:hypothetical protein